ncbi:hypothetical protein OIU76_023744 [Salix suchowensis]|nr:hypothetical protein OIU76_023744 [Salix suchowensis]
MRPRGQELKKLGAISYAKEAPVNLKDLLTFQFISPRKRDQPSLYPGNGGGIVLKDHNNKITLPTEGSGKAFPSELPLAPVRQPENYSSSVAYNHPMPYPANYSNPSVGGPSYPPAAGPSYQPSRTPPPPPPPTNQQLDLEGPRPGLAMGVGAGALAAGAVIFGDDFHVRI